MDMEIYKMEYNIRNKTNKLRVIGEDFMKNNKNKGKLIINNKKVPLYDIISFDYKEQTKIKLIISVSIFNKASMFKNCKELKSLSKLSVGNSIDDINYNENNINEDCQSYIGNNNNINFFKDSDLDLDEESSSNSFYNDYSAPKSEIPNEQNKNLNSIIILYFYEKLKYFGSNYTILKEMFYNCESLSSLPDIDLWNINNVIDISCMFYNCKSLLYLPDISN